jgi:hypothetical protein
LPTAVRLVREHATQSRNPAHRNFRIILFHSIEEKSDKTTSREKGLFGCKTSFTAKSTDCYLPLDVNDFKHGPIYINTPSREFTFMLFLFKQKKQIFLEKKHQAALLVFSH